MADQDSTNPAADATARPQPPEYVTKLIDKEEIDWMDEKVQLFDMSFLGVHFADRFSPKDPIPHFINAELGRRLVAAQTSLYWKCLAEKQQQRQQEQQEQPGKNLTLVTTVSEADFRQWCWLGQEPKVIGSHGGLKDTNNPRSRHSSGSAMDVNAPCNPYMPTRSFERKDGNVREVLGGELQQRAKGSEAAFPGAEFRKFHEEKIWKPAMEIFDRAHSLFYGSPADIQLDGDFEHAEDIYKRFKRLSYATSAYFRYGFPDGQQRDRKNRSFDEFKTLFTDDVKSDLIHPDAVFNGNKLLPAVKSQKQNDVLKALFGQIVADFIPIQRATVSGTLAIASDGTITFPALNQRDPCLGVFNLRQEAFVELVKVQRLRWGGCMFGAAASGDSMHFDLDGHFVNGQRFEVTGAKAPFVKEKRQRLKGDPPEPQEK